LCWVACALPFSDDLKIGFLDLFLSLWHWLGLAIVCHFVACIGLALVFVRHWFYCIGFVLYRLRITAHLIDNEALFRASKPRKQIPAGLVLQMLTRPVIP
jgi:hypothetical protein